MILLRKHSDVEINLQLNQYSVHLIFVIFYLMTEKGYLNIFTRSTTCSSKNPINDIISKPTGSNKR
jgi:hypothetical protein